ncbi:polysaccharide biosynthesis tyrosine autokinase [Paraburkholderia phenoliruptrix]|uniref:Putative tyrosine-protein kinase EpsB n=2 Tax=Paraburkholderia phenoliruptrix TaxID=252970 RepID=K0DYU6_9BURK|nr:protein-tyrosine kinase [Paraburkholderia phenoliruptrix BR3459a]CAB4052756.1 Tyrosine-protein kinase wzc [Paraburkholderia phenoliruptrix]
MNVMTRPPSHPVDEEEQFDLVTILDVVIESRWLIGIVACACLTLGVLYAFIAEPVYQTDIMIQVEESPDASAAKSMLGDVSSLFDVKSTAAAESQILASRLVVTRAVEKLRLYIDASPRRFPLIGSWLARDRSQLSKPGFLGFGGYGWGAERIDVPRFDVPQTLEGERFRVTVVDANHYRLSGSGLDEPFVGQPGRLETIPSAYGPLYLRVDTLRGNPGAKFNLIRFSKVKTISNLQDKLDVQEKVKQSGVLIASLQDKSPLRVASILNAIAEQYVFQNVERKSAEAAQSLRFLDTQLPEIKSRLEQAQARYTAMRDKRGSLDLTEEAKIALGQSADAKTRLLELQQRRDELARRFNPGHPAIRTIDAQMANLRHFSDETSARIKALPDAQQDIVRLMLDVQVNTDLYTSLLNNFQQLQLVKAGKTGNVRLVDQASIPEDPVKPKRVLVIAGAALVGVFLGVVVAFVRNMLFRGISDPNEIERRSGLHVYSTIPLSELQPDLYRRIRAREPGVKLLAVDAPEDPTIESFRSLRTALQFTMFNAKNNVVLVTGPAPSVGKSFVSANFAAVLTTAGRRVLLIDADLRKGYLHQYFGFERGIGLSEIISGQQTVESALHRNVLPNLDFIATGVQPRNPAELLLSERVTNLIREVSAMYDIIVIDTAPVLAAADAGILAPAAGTVFLVARATVTKMGELTESMKRLAQNGVSATGVLFNGLNLRHARYGYGSKYGAYRYAAYTYESDATK